MLKKFFEVKSVIVTWIISYIAILIIPLAVSLIVFMNVEHIVSEEVLISNNYLLKQIQQEVDNILNEVKKINTDIMFDYNIQKVLAIKDHITAEQYYDIHMAQTNIRRLKLAGINVNDVFIYLNNSDLVVDSDNTLDSRNYYNIHVNKETISYEDWLDRLKTKYPAAAYFPVSKVLSDGKKQGDIMCLQTFGYETEEYFTSACFIEQAKISEYFQNILDMNNGYINIYNAAGQMLLPEDPRGIFRSLTDGDLRQTQTYTYKKIGRENYVVTYIDSSVSDWKYVCAFSNKEFSKKTDHVRLLIMAGLLISILAGGLLLIYAVRRNYNPVRAMISSITGKVDTPFAGENEYAFITSVVNSTLDKNRETSSKLQKQHSIIKNYYYLRLLRGNDISGFSTEDSRNLLDLSSKSKNFLVVMLYLEDSSSLFAEEKNLDDNRRFLLSMYIIKNIVSEMFSEQYETEAVEVDQTLVCVLSLEDGRQAPQKEIAAILRQARDFIRENFDITPKAVVSNPCGHILELSEAYQECLRAQEYNMMFDSGGILFYSSISFPQKSGYYFPMDKEYQLINSIKLGDGGQCRRLLNEIYQTNQDNHLSGAKMKLLLSDLLSTIMKVIYNDADYSALAAAAEAAADRLGSDSAWETQQQLFAITEELCRISTEKLQHKSSRLTEDVMRYIQENYTNPDLNVSNVGDAFQMAPSYISKKFKEEQGLSLLDYIHSIRLEKAKELIENGRNTIEEISAMVGYSEARTFARVFKKIYGVSPSEYKKINL